MRKRHAFLLLAVLAAGCASAPDKSLQSGFLPDYSQLKERDCAEKTITGEARAPGTCFTWATPTLAPHSFNAIILERLAFFPEPKPTEYVSQETLDRIRNYVDSKMRAEIGKRITLVNTPGPGVVRMRWAITAASAETRSLKFYQYIPVALVVTAATAAVQGGLPKDAKVAFETEITDSLTRQPIWLTLRTGTGERIKAVASGEKKLDPDHLKKLFDAWSEDGATAMAYYFKPKP